MKSRHKRKRRQARLARGRVFMGAMQELLTRVYGCDVEPVPGHLGLFRMTL